MTQERLAEAAELDLSYVQRVERASVNASLAIVAALAAALGVPPATLLARAAPPVVKRGRPKAPRGKGLAAVRVHAAASRAVGHALEDAIRRPKRTPSASRKQRPPR